MPSQWLEAVAAGCLIVFAMSAKGAETVIGDVGATRFPGGEGSYGGSLTLQSTSPRGGVLVGVSGTDYPVGSLTVGNVDGYWIRSSAFLLSAGAAIGEAAAGPGSSTLYKAHLALDAQLATIWSLHVADQYVALDVVHGHLGNVGLLYRPTKQWDVGATAAWALGGTLEDRYGQLTANWYGAQHFFGGVVLGRTGYDPANLGSSAITRRLVETYLGAGIPVHKGTLTVTVDNTSLEGAARQTLRIGFTEPITP